MSKAATTKKNPLEAAFKDAEDEIASPKPIAAAAPVTVTTPMGGASKGRVGTSLVGAHLPKRYAKTLKLIAAEEDDVTQQDLLAEALDMLFAKKGK